MSTRVAEYFERQEKRGLVRVSPFVPVQYRDQVLAFAELTRLYDNGGADAVKFIEGVKAITASIVGG